MAKREQFCQDVDSDEGSPTPREARAVRLTVLFGTRVPATLNSLCTKCCDRHVRVPRLGEGVDSWARRAMTPDLSKACVALAIPMAVSVAVARCRSRLATEGTRAAIEARVGTASMWRMRDSEVPNPACVEWTVAWWSRRLLAHDLCDPGQPEIVPTDLPGFVAARRTNAGRRHHCRSPPLQAQGSARWLRMTPVDSGLGELSLCMPRYLHKAPQAERKVKREGGTARRLGDIQAERRVDR